MASVCLACPNLILAASSVPLLAMGVSILPLQPVIAASTVAGATAVALSTLRSGKSTSRRPVVAAHTAPSFTHTHTAVLSVAMLLRLCH